MSKSTNFLMNSGSAICTDKNFIGDRRFISGSFRYTDFKKDVDSDWDQYKQVHKKDYSPEEESLRRLVWEDNVRHILKHNEEADRGEHTYWLGENEYADMTISEFSAIMNGYIMNASSTEVEMYMSPSNIDDFPDKVDDLPDKVDWRDEGYVTAVKNQKNCGSCWTFSATGALEGQHFKVDKKLVSLSEQNIIDCSHNGGDHGCKGGHMDSAFTYVAKNKGIDTEESYPYKAKTGHCRFKRKHVGATDTGYVKIIPHQSESALQEAVATVGPISVAVDAGHKSFQLYKKGVYSEPSCSSTKVDHGMLVVGYGSEGSKDYWLVKNRYDVSHPIISLTGPAQYSDKGI